MKKTPISDINRPELREMQDIRDNAAAKARKIDAVANKLLNKMMKLAKKRDTLTRELNLLTGSIEILKMDLYTKRQRHLEQVEINLRTSRVLKTCRLKGATMEMRKMA